jgi:PTS system ascorbate-specific IIA component
VVGILIVAHGTFGESLIHCASHVLGKRPMQVGQVGLTVHDEPHAILLQAQELARQLDDGSGVLVLTDMVGATPANVAARLAVAGKIEVVSGANLPMLVRALTYRNQPLAAVLAKAMSGGCEGVVHIGAPGKNAAAGR